MTLMQRVNFYNYSPLKHHGDTVVTHSPPTSEDVGSNPGPYMGKLVVAYQWSAVYSTEPSNCMYWLSLATKLPIVI